MVESYDMIVICLCLAALICQTGFCVRFSTGNIEWGNLCKLNSSDFEPENVVIQRPSPTNSRYPSLYTAFYQPKVTPKAPLSPCCFPETWESGFVVYTRRIGVKSRGDLSLFRIRRHADKVESVMVIGQTVLSTLLCSGTQNTSVLKVCPKDKKQCLQIPFLGEPRCVSKETGFHLITQPEAEHEMWFTDSRIPSGGIKRHVYSFMRRFGLCRLEKYQILTGQYVDSRTNCRLMFLQDQLFVPMTGSFQLNFTHPLDENLFQCKHV